MKKLLIALSTVCVLSMSASAMADKKPKLVVIGSDITQTQKGMNQHQDAIIGLVTPAFSGDATIIVKKSTITQTQGGSANRQTAKIGVIGCDCIEKGGPKPR